MFFNFIASNRRHRQFVSSLLCEIGCCCHVCHFAIRNVAQISNRWIIEGWRIESLNFVEISFNEKSFLLLFPLQTLDILFHLNFNFRSVCQAWILEGRRARRLPAKASKRREKKKTEKKTFLMTGNFFKFDLEVSAWMGKKKKEKGKEEKQRAKVFKRDFSWLHFDGFSLFSSLQRSQPLSGPASPRQRRKRYLDAGNHNLLLIEAFRLISLD